MKEVEVFQWMLPPDIWRKRPHPSTYKMDRATAEARYPGASPIQVTREVRMLPSTEEELRQAMAAGQRPQFPPKLR